MKEKDERFLTIDKIIENKKISHAFLIEVDEEYTTSFTNNIIKKILKKVVKEEEFAKISSLIDCNNFPEVKIIKPDGKYIKKEQLSQLMSELKNKPIYSNNIFYVIEFAENLNNSSANTILKFLEEPEEGIIAILITKNIYNVLPTISSRCQVLNFNKYEKKQFDESFLHFAIDFIVNFTRKKKQSVAYLSELYTLKSQDLIEIFNISIIIYFDVLKYKNTAIKSDFIQKNEEISIILDIIDTSEVIYIINKLTDALNLLKYNINARIVLDKIIIGENEEVVL